jgi:hypothetical protein
MALDPDSKRRLAAYLDWALSEIRRETGEGELTERANELIGHAEAVAQRLGPSAFGARFRESTRAIARH